MDLDDHNARLLQDSVPLLRLSFSPLALQLDRAAMNYEPRSFVACFLRAGARLVSFLALHVAVSVNVSTEDTDNVDQKHHCSLGCLHLHANSALDRIFEGYGVIFRAKYQTPLLVLLLWRIKASKNFLDVYGALKRKVPECKISVEEAMNIPMIYSKFCETSYMPSSDLIVIE